VLVRGEGAPQLRFPGFRDMRGYRAMYGDFVRAIRDGRVPEMSLEAAMDDQRLMDQIYASLRTENGEPRTPDPGSRIPDPGRIHVQ